MAQANYTADDIDRQGTFPSPLRRQSRRIHHTARRVARVFTRVEV